MKHSKVIRRISLGLVCITFGVYMAADGLGLVPNHVETALKGRKALGEAMALGCARTAKHGDMRAFKQTLAMIVERNEDLLSAALRDPSGEFLFEVGEHRAYWANRRDNQPSATHMFVPIAQGGKRLGNLEFCFRPPDRYDPWGLISLTSVVLMAFVAIVGFLVYYFYLSRLLAYLNPSDVVPDRVRNTLDTLGEGLLVLDNDQRVLLANKAFAQLAGKKPEDIQGFKAADMPWKVEVPQDGGYAYPWTQTFNDGQRRSGVRLKLDVEDTGTRTLRVNCSPIADGDGGCRGVLVTFDDITLLEERNATLADTLGRLKESKDTIREQNEQLTLLATRDPLTLCLNRRAFFEEFSKHMQACRTQEKPLCCLLLDVDHFKSVNDNHGHAAGDAILKMVAEAAREAVGNRGTVGRYGGEEFAAVLPGLDIDAAEIAAQDVRKAIQAGECDGLSVTASVGVAMAGNAAWDQQVVMEQADEAMYAAKRTGRNRVIRWDQMPTESELKEPEPESPTIAQQAADESVPFRAVVTLLSALRYRHPATADHCQRVADLCLATAEGLMSPQQRYLLEVAALLHDVGKLGVPDAILLKPNRLSESELRVMRTYEQIGVDIVATAFPSPELADIVRHHHAWFGVNPNDSRGLSGEDIPLGSRILFIAEAYDSMIADQAYRPGRSHEEAVAELRRCAGSQFDPEITERFIRTVESLNQRSNGEESGIARQAALCVGLEIEKLACALDAKDASTLASMAATLKTTAAQNGFEEIAEVAGRLQNRAASPRQDEEESWIENLRLGADLLELCRTTQASLITRADHSGNGAPPPGDHHSVAATSVS